MEDKIYYSIISDFLRATRLDGTNPQVLRALAAVVEETQARLKALEPQAPQL